MDARSVKGEDAPEEEATAVLVVNFEPVVEVGGWVEEADEG